MKSTAKILLALCIALLPSVVSARTYRLVQCHIVEFFTGKEYDLQREQLGEVSYDIVYDFRARIYRGKVPNDYYSNGYYGKKQIEFKEYGGYLTEVNNGRAIKIYLKDLGYIYTKSEYNPRKSYLIYEAVY